MVKMPNAEWIWAHVLNSMWALTIEDNWEKSGNVDVSDAIFAAADITESFQSMVGTIFLVGWAEIPDGWLVCDGTVYARGDYPTLYDVLDIVFHIDADNFIVPDMSGRVPLGESPDFSIGAMDGEERHTLTVAEMPSHTHIYTPPVFNVDIEAPGAPDPLAAGVGIPTNTGSAGSSDSHNNMQPYTVLRYVIAAR